MAIYAALMRPPEPGAIPREGRRACRFENGWLLNEEGQITHHFYGLVEYDRVLTREETDHYDLVRVERMNICLIRNIREGTSLDEIYSS